MDRGEGQQWNKAPGNLYCDAAKMSHRPAKAETITIVARPGHSADPEPADHEVRQARKRPERAAHEVLGPSDVPRRARPAARGLRHAPERALSARHQPRPLPGHDRRLARGAGAIRIWPPSTPSGFTGTGYNRTEQELAHQFYKDWTGPRLSAHDSSSRSSTPTRTTTIRTR